MQKHSLRFGVVALTAALAMTGCGGRGSSESSPTGGASDTAAATGSDTAATTQGSAPAGGNKVAKIGVIAPLTGDLSPLGLGIQHSVELAVKEANAKKLVPGWTFQVVAKDDAGQPGPAQNAASQLAGDAQMLGVVGTLNTSTSLIVQPILNSKKIAQVSPANTGPKLTMGESWQKSPKRPFPGYFRTCATDAVQGPAAAQYLWDKGIKSVATINDKKAYGQGLVATFEEKYKQLGGKVTASTTIDPKQSNFNTAVSQVRQGNPQAVYYGGEFPQAGPLSRQMHQKGLKVPLMGGDGIFDPKFIELGGKNSDGDLATSVGAPIESLASGKSFVKAYNDAKFKDTYGAYGGYAYDAANALLNAAKTSLASAKDVTSARPAQIAAVGKVSFDGVTGKVAFDQYGDTTTKVITVYTVKDQKWAPDSTKDYK